MCCELCDGSWEAKDVFQEADEVLGFSLTKLCFEGPPDELKQTINSQPAILTASVAYLRATPELNGQMRPHFVAGHSLGEYTALIAANVLDFASALRLVRERGRLMQEAGKMEPGGMAAIIGLDPETVEQVCVETAAQIANVNCPGQIVVSGRREAVANAMDLAQARGAVGTVALEVSGAFHSELMRPAIEGMNRAISDTDFRTPEIPIIANASAKPMTTVEEVKEELIRQLCSCVRWQPSIEYMAESGVTTYIEIGPGIVLTKLIKRIVRKAKVLNMNDAEDIRTLEFERSSPA
jgi:[acyl-carrier-protein] S-malonyltransferase